MRKLIDEMVCEYVGDILLSPSVFRRIYEEEKAVGNDVTLLPGLVVMRLQDGEVNYIWKNGAVVAQVYAYK